jgi:two-component system response regulator MtrA
MRAAGGGFRGGATVLVAESDSALSQVLTYILRREGYRVIVSRDGVETMQLWKEQEPALILLNTDLPVLDGRVVCQWIRLQSTTLIILLSTASDEEDILRGLESGADDYVTIPFSPRLLVARMRAVLRWQRRDPVSSWREEASLSAGDVRLEPASQTVECGGVSTVLTPTQFRLLYALVLHDGQVLTYGALRERAWGFSDADDSRMVTGQISNLRRRLESNPHRPVNINSIPGVGFAVRPPLEPDGNR